MKSFVVSCAIQWILLATPAERPPAFRSSPTDDAGWPVRASRIRLIAHGTGPTTFPSTTGQKEDTQVTRNPGFPDFILGGVALALFYIGLLAATHDPCLAL